MLFYLGQNEQCLKAINRIIVTDKTGLLLIIIIIIVIIIIIKDPELFIMKIYVSFKLNKFYYYCYYIVVVITIIIIIIIIAFVTL